MPRRHFVEIVTVGDEILLGETLNGNAAFLARACARAGFEVRRVTTLPDDEEPLRAGFLEARSRGGTVIVTGGLGPTRDDVTRRALAGAFQRELVLQPALLAEIEEKFRAFGYTAPPPGNRSQAELPEGALAIPNRGGTAAGILLESEGSAFYLLPGVPSEMELMFTEEILPRLVERAGGELAELRLRVIRTAGIGESLLASRIDDLVREAGAVRVAFLPDRGSVDLRLTVAGVAADEADRALDALETKIVERLAPWVYGRGRETLAAAVGRALTALGETVAVAESCTGGLVADMLTDVPGSSAYFGGGLVAYSNRLKRDLLGVPGEILDRHGAVSAETCAAMLAGVRRRTGTGCALALTGIAGPSGGTPAKPVGLVHYGVDVRGDVRLERGNWPGSRRDVKRRAAKAGLLLLLRTAEVAAAGGSRSAVAAATAGGRQWR